MLLVIQKWSFPTSSLFSFHQTRQQGPSLWTLESYETLRLKYRNMLLEFLLSHEDMTALADVIKKVNVGDAVDWVSRN